MVECHAQPITFDELCQFVAATLSQLENLEPDRYELTRHVLTRGGRPCGVHFCLHGPRAVCLTAIWETDRNTVLFYDSSGRRLGRTRLTGRPTLPTPNSYADARRAS